jgi:hypothetical protein
MRLKSWQMAGAAVLISSFLACSGRVRSALPSDRDGTVVRDMPARSTSQAGAGGDTADQVAAREPGQAGKQSTAMAGRTSSEAPPGGASAGSGENPKPMAGSAADSGRNAAGSSAAAGAAAGSGAGAGAAGNGGTAGSAQGEDDDD